MDSTLVVKDADELTIYVSATTDYKDPSYRSRVDELLSQAVNTAYSLQVTKHIANFQKLFDRVSIKLGTTTREDLPS